MENRVANAKNAEVVAYVPITYRHIDANTAATELSANIEKTSTTAEGATAAKDRRPTL